MRVSSLIILTPILSPIRAVRLDDELWIHQPAFYDHSDHVWGARFANEALKGYDRLLNVKIPNDSIYR